ncbi:hypothetical protein MXL46_08070 [Heyndrickxia sporothermodurans]|uniref:hypothetical protein n=1 Tax=Heyndrickxia sporothermodurans TaxID=46224 RepID=UPI002DB829D6|nr:hypothetical protein [Heyndrickxia sporothermodurans]MEB6549050.1 hypothetical protein [Heyndrickxia sporothermodurans]MED1711691.1 hypothetical protein [Bacillus thuringiensis]
MKKVMVRAWEIAKEGVKKFGGKVKEYFAQALAMAWAEVKNAAQKFEIEVPGNDRRNVKTWVAKIVGKHPKFVFDREFLNADEFDKYGYKYFYVADGVYERFDGKRKNLIIVENGKGRLSTREEVLSIVG